MLVTLGKWRFVPQWQAGKAIESEFSSWVTIEADMLPPMQASEKSPAPTLSEESFFCTQKRPGRFGTPREAMGIRLKVLGLLPGTGKNSAGMLAPVQTITVQPGLSLRFYYACGVS